jgi:threonine dehydratase
MVTLQEIQGAADTIRGRVIRTPLIYSPSFSSMTGVEVHLKLEAMQRSGSFKVRGATNKILGCRGDIGPSGVVAASAGNHAQGVAVAAQQAGIPATIVMPEWVSIRKQQATQEYGARVILQGRSIDESVSAALGLAEQGMTFIHPYDDPAVIAGQGTIGLEILEDLKNPDAIIVPVGGGGLISGIATAVRSLRPETRIIGVQAEACPCAQQAMEAGEIVLVDAPSTIADGIRVGRLGEYTFPVIKELVDRVILVREDEIAQAMLLLLERKKVLAEGAGAAPVAALLSGRAGLVDGDVVVLVISGGNVDIPLLDRIMRQGMLRSGRIMRFSVCLNDVPNELARMLSVIAEFRGNILHVHHARGGKDLPLFRSEVEVEVESNGFHHIKEIEAALRDRGYQIRMN